MLSIFSIKHWLKSQSLLMHLFHIYQNYRYQQIFTVKDFSLITLGINRFQLRFTNRFGYQLPRYSPIFSYLSKDQIWQIRVNGVTLTSPSNPIFVLINELRGYSLLGTIHKGDVVIDAGASDGFVTRYLAALAGPRGKVVALEPDPTFSDPKLSSKITLVRACLARRTGTSRLILSTFGSSQMSRNGSQVVATITLSDLLTRYHARQVSFIKLDIEGSELEVINDLLKLITRSPRLIVAIASYHLVKGQPTWQAIEAKANKFPLIYVRTIYPYHATTYLVNTQNTRYLRKLQQLPRYNDIYDQVWPSGENWQG